MKKSRSSYPEVLHKKEVLKNFAKPQENICTAVFFNRVRDLSTVALLKRDLACFHLNFRKFSRGSILLNFCEQQLLKNVYLDSIEQYLTKSVGTISSHIPNFAITIFIKKY